MQGMVHVEQAGAQLSGLLQPLVALTHLFGRWEHPGATVGP